MYPLGQHRNCLRISSHRHKGTRGCKCPPHLQTRRSDRKGFCFLECCLLCSSCLLVLEACIGRCCSASFLEHNILLVHNLMAICTRVSSGWNIEPVDELIGLQIKQLLFEVINPWLEVLWLCIRIGKFISSYKTYFPLVGELKMDPNFSRKSSQYNPLFRCHFLN